MNNKFSNQKYVKCLSFLLLAFFSITAYYYYYIDVYLIAQKWPNNTFLFHPNARFGDYFSNINKLNSGDHKFFGSLDFMPLLNAIIIIFAKIQPVGHSYIIHFFIPFSVIFFLFFNAGKKMWGNRIDSLTTTFIFVFLSYPILFAFDRGNIEIYGFVLMLLFIYFWETKPKLGVAFYALSLLLKPFPIFFLPLFLKKDKRYLLKYLALFYVCFFLFLYAFIVSSLNEISIRELLNNKTVYSAYTETFVIGNLGLGYGHSFFGLLKVIGFSFGIDKISSLLLKPYFYTVALIYVFIAYFVYKNINFYENTLVLSICMCLFPYVSADYKLLYLMLPLLALMHSSQPLNVSRNNCIVFGLLIAVKPFASISILNPTLIPLEVSYNVVLSPLLMLALLLMTVLPRFSKLPR